MTQRKEPCFALKEMPNGKLFCRATENTPGAVCDFCAFYKSEAKRQADLERANSLFNALSSKKKNELYTKFYCNGNASVLQKVWKSEEIETVKRMLLDGKTHTQIAAVLHISNGVLNAQVAKLKKMGFVYGNQRDRWTQEDENRLTQLLKDGLTASQITNKMGIDEDRLQSKLYHKYGTYSLDKAREAVQNETGQSV